MSINSFNISFKICITNYACYFALSSAVFLMRVKNFKTFTTLYATRPQCLLVSFHFTVQLALANNENYLVYLLKMLNFLA
jgi:hypothetical protein